ncbi:hypothetical protein LEP1GSC059_2621 [Leptospira noguchii serovar Panama str. CZ214]|uniref:Uncharacterized protein n=1 Tax=Leptospira noguchii serovar Panama str. CZ214 TaxID=1001595 RepID=T0FMF2_9LEPT|nr:hypothetical protein LEP1GSC059_2621 [Leptospira noguchii serovar Panama str. CZ214]
MFPNLQYLNFYFVKIGIERRFGLKKLLGEIEKDEIYKNFVCRNLGI